MFPQRFLHRRRERWSALPWTCSQPWAALFWVAFPSSSNSTREGKVSLKLCTKFGLVAGGAVGVLVNLLQWLVSAVTPTIAQLSLDGLVVALITMTLAAAFACLIRRELSLLIFFLAFLIGAVVGIVLG